MQRFSFVSAEPINYTQSINTGITVGYSQRYFLIVYGYSCIITFVYIFQGSYENDPLKISFVK